MSRSEAGRLELRGFQGAHIELLTVDLRGLNGITDGEDVREVAA